MTNMNVNGTVDQFLKNLGINKNGKADLDKLAKAVVGPAIGLGVSAVSQMRSIFEIYSKKDGNAEISANEYIDAINSNDAQAVLKKLEEKRAELSEKSELLNADFGLTGEESDTIRESMVKRHGEKFVTEVYDPMQKMANNALDYMVKHNGQLEGFSFAGVPRGIKIIDVRSRAAYGDVSNDVMNIQNGKTQITRKADTVYCRLVFEFEGETFIICSENEATDLTPFGNPYYIDNGKILDGVNEKKATDPNVGNKEHK